MYGDSHYLLGSMRIGRVFPSVRYGFFFLSLLFTLQPAAYGLRAQGDSVNRSVLEVLWEASSENPSDTVRGRCFRDSLVAHLMRAHDPLDCPIPVLRGLMDLRATQGKMGVRVVTWAHGMEDRTELYMGLVLCQRKGQPVHLTLLNDRRVPLQEGRIEEDWLTFQHTGSAWFGAAYYSIVPFEHGGVACFALCGLAGGSPFVVRRMVETLQIPEEGPIIFGCPVIVYREKNYCRLLFSHGARVAMTLHPLPTSAFAKPRILIDHLCPSHSQYGGIPQYYGPDGTQDALQLQRDGTWLFEEDVLVTAPSGKR